MSEAPVSETQHDESRSIRNVLIGIAVGAVVVTLALVAGAVVLAANPQAATPGVQVVRDLMIIALALEMIIIGAAITVLLIQIARFINLISNEVQPIITSTSDTINTVRGTAVFLSKHLAEPVTKVSGTLRGISKVMGDVEAIRKAAGMAAAAASAMSPTGASHSSTTPVAEQPSEEQPDHREQQADVEEGSEQTQEESAGKTATHSKGGDENGR